MVFAHSHIISGMHFCASLTDNNIACTNKLPTKLFNTLAASRRIAVILGATLTFLVCHFNSLTILSRDFYHAHTRKISSKASFCFAIFSASFLKSDDLFTSALIDDF